MTIFNLPSFEQIALIGVMLTAFLSLGYAWWLRGTVLTKEKGTQVMQDIWRTISEGAEGYLGQQLRSILPLIGVLAVLMFFTVFIVPPTLEAREWYCGVIQGQGEATRLVCAQQLRAGSSDYTNVQIIFGVARTIAFIMGASFSLTVGQLGMRMAIQANVRAAWASRKGFNEALSIAYYAGTITGMLTDGLGLFGGTLIFMVFVAGAPDALLGFGFGGTLLALFMRVGGGIYTKAADVGADLVGKVEKDIPEDDPRNAAVIADLVGDNVGDCAGMAADIFESYEVTIVSGLILGLALYMSTGDLKWIIYPLIIRAIGVISSILGTFTVPIWEKIKIPLLHAHDAEEAMFRSYEVSSVNTVFWAFMLAGWYTNWTDFRLALLTAIGVGLAVAFNPLTSYFTSTKRPPVKEIVKSTNTGPATTILTGMSVGMESSVWALCVIVVAFTCALLLYGGEKDTTYVLYAVAMVGIGMLSHTGNNVAMDSYGPISDNANGIAEMAWHDLDDAETKKARQIMADLDAVGNTTKAITKGVAIASAVIAAVSLFASFITDVKTVQLSLGVSPENILNAIRVSDTRVFIGLLLGGALPWLFGSLAIRAVSRAAAQIVEEVRRQFRNPKIMTGEDKPDYKRVVSISTSSAQKELIPLATISVLVPLMVGLVLQVEALGGFLAGVILSGQLLAVYMANAGGAWDNAKKSVEDEPRDLVKNTGKGSERHKAAVVGDTVGDPLKDTAGPALNPMIKVGNLVSLLFAPIIVKYPIVDNGVINWVVVIIAVLMLAAVIWALAQSGKETPALEAAK